MAEPQASFPRGKRPLATPSSKKEGSASATPKNRKRTTMESDFLFGSSSASSKKKKKKTSSASKTKKPNEEETLIEALSFNKLGKGTKLLGIVREVYKEFCLVSLPNLLTGYILPSTDQNESVSLQDQLSVGQVLAVYVLKVASEEVGSTKKGRQHATTRRRIQLSVDPRHLNATAGEESFDKHTSIRGRVLSIQDYGVMVDLGNGRKGFCRFDAVEGGNCVTTAATNDGEDDDSITADHHYKLNPGRIHDFFLSSSSSKADLNNSKSILQLALPGRKAVAKKVLPSSYHPSLLSLTPGGLVQAKIKSIAKNGLTVTFGDGVFEGAIHLQHLGGHWIPNNRNESMEWKQVFENHPTSLQARILCVDPKTKLVRLSIQPHVLNLTKPPGSSLMDVGSIIQDATVIRYDTGIGALLSLPSTTSQDVSDALPPTDHVIASKRLWQDESYQQASSVPAVYVHISKATSNRISNADFAKEFAPSTQHTVRIWNTSHWMEGLCAGATSDEYVQAHVLQYSNLIPGQVYRNVAVCGNLKGGSILVDFGLGIRGLIPKLHLFDTSMNSEYRLKLHKEKYALNRKVDVRILEVNAETKRCIVTAKKSLLQQDGNKALFANYANLTAGSVGTGFVSSINDKSLFVTFYNNVYGRVTAKSLAAEMGIENHKEDYKMGDVVKCRVISCKRRMKNRQDDGLNDDDDGADQENAFWELNLSLNVELGGQDEDDEEMEEDHVQDDDDAKMTNAKEDKSQPVRLQPGMILPPKSMKVVELVSSIDKKHGPGFIPGHAIVRVKSKYITAATQDVSSIPYIECKIPFDQVLDTYSKEDVDSKEKMDSFAKAHLVIGKKVDRPGLVLTDPKRTRDEYASAIGKLPAVSLRPKLIATVGQAKSDKEAGNVMVPSPDSGLFMGAFLQGFVHQVDPRHGAFVHFLQGMTGLIPKIKNGTSVPKWETVTCKVIALDMTCQPPKILLQRSSPTGKDVERISATAKMTTLSSIKPGDTFESAQVVDVNFSRATLRLGKKNEATVRARIHVTMAESETTLCTDNPDRKKSSKEKDANNENIRKGHPFYKWKVGKEVFNLTCVSVHDRNGVTYVEMSTRVDSELPVFVEESSEMKPGSKYSCIVVGVAKSKRGIWVQPSPGLSCFVPALELSSNAQVLNDMSSYFVSGTRIECTVMDKKAWKKRKNWGGPKLRSDDSKQANEIPFMSVLLDNPEAKFEKPQAGEALVGRINRSLRLYRAPSLMLELRGGYRGRCCITELEEPDEWSNMPLGRQQEQATNTANVVVTDEEEEPPTTVGENGDEEDELTGQTDRFFGYNDGEYVPCRVLARIAGEPIVELSLRQSRVEGDLDDDETPEENELVNAYVVTANAKGCFLRLSRKVEGRVVLKELADGFLPDPSTSFPMGRLVIGLVKKVKESTKRGKVKLDYFVDMDMRESKLIDNEKNKITFEDLNLQDKCKGTVTRIEDYGVFVRLADSHVSGLVHKSECSDSYVKNIHDLYDPGDLVKVVVIKKHDEGKKIGFSMKASHFEGDADSEDDSSVEEIEDMEVEDDEDIQAVQMSESGSEDSIDSDDENYVSKLAAKMNDGDGDTDSDSDEDDSNSKSDSDSDGDDSNDEEKASASQSIMDTNVGFKWGDTTTAPDAQEDASSDDSSSYDSDDDDERNDEGDEKTTSHSSRKKAAARRRKEEATRKRELALADGTAELETPTDFERLLAAEPNVSEHWIRYMAYYLTTGDVESSRKVAQRALDRIDFTNEGEKLNIWTAWLTLELKFGGSFQDILDKACQSNNPKHVYARACELMQKQNTDNHEATDALFEKACRKFRSKKTLWIAYMQHLLQTQRPTNAHELMKRALQSLASYKHLEVMSKLAQMEFEYGDVERGRTVFDGILTKYPKRLDVLFVFCDKEIKLGHIDAARKLFQKVTLNEERKLKDKAMKKVFQKWFRVEQEYGTEESQEAVKDAARTYVDRTS